MCSILLAIHKQPYTRKEEMHETYIEKHKNSLEENKKKRKIIEEEKAMIVNPHT